MQFRSRHREDETTEGGELLRPFGPGQIAFQFGRVVELSFGGHDNLAVRTKTEAYYE
jgi:hypothetical protein